MQWRVHVGVAEASADHLQDGGEIAGGNSLTSRPEHVLREDGPRDRAGSGGRTRRLSAASAEEEADAAVHPALTEVDVREQRRAGEVVVSELELDARVVVQHLHVEDGATGRKDGGHLLRADQICAEARSAILSSGGERDEQRKCYRTKRFHVISLRGPLEQSHGDSSSSSEVPGSRAEGRYSKQREKARVHSPSQDATREAFAALCQSC